MTAEREITGVKIKFLDRELGVYVEWSGTAIEHRALRAKFASKCCETVTEFSRPCTIAEAFDRESPVTIEDLHGMSWCLAMAYSNAAHTYGAHRWLSTVGDIYDQSGLDALSDKDLRRLGVIFKQEAREWYAHESRSGEGRMDWGQTKSETFEDCALVIGTLLHERKRQRGDTQEVCKK